MLVWRNWYPQVAAEEKQRALQGKEAELQQLRQSLRERDRLIEKINSAVLESEENNKVSMRLFFTDCNENNVFLGVNVKGFMTPTLFV